MSCMLDCAKTQAQLNALLICKIKGKAKLRWTLEVEAAFQEAKDNWTPLISRIALLFSSN